RRRWPPGYVSHLVGQHRNTGDHHEHGEPPRPADHSRLPEAGGGAQGAFGDQQGRGDTDEEEPRGQGGAADEEAGPGHGGFESSFTVNGSVDSTMCPSTDRTRNRTT